MKVFLRFYLCLLSCCLPLPSLAQGDFPYSLRISRQNDFTWFSALDIRQELKKGKWSLEGIVNQEQIFNSSLSSNQFVQQSLKTSIWQYYTLKPKLDAACWLETDQYFSTKNEKISLYAGVRARPMSFLTLTPMVGYTIDRRSGTRDQGFTPALLVRVDKDLPDGLRYLSTAFFRYKSISPRRQYNAAWQQTLSKSFGGDASIVASLNATSNELDDYSGQMVKRIISDTLAPQLQLLYQFNPKVSWESNNRFMVSRRRFEFDALPEGMLSENNISFSGLEINLFQRIAANLGKIRLYGSYEFNYHSRRYALENITQLNPTEFDQQEEREKEKDFLKNENKINATAEWQFSRRHKLTARYENQYVMYDTPSESNFDDRDELTHYAATEWATQWRRNFFTSFALSGNYRHYAFLFAEKSQDNYIQRTIRSEFRFRWNLHRTFTAEGTQAVYSTYNVKDFREFGSTDRSTRNLESSLKLNWQPTERWAAKVQMNRKETHQSFLNWEAFSETTLDTTDYLTIENKWRRTIPAHQSSRNWYLEFGYKHFSQVRKLPAMMAGNDLIIYPVSLKQIVLRTGPLGGFGIKTANGSQLELLLWMQVQSKKFKYKILTESGGFSQTFSEDELNEVVKSLEPYPNLILLFRF